MDTDVTMVPAGEASSSSSRKPKRFEIKKWNAVALWAWDIVVDNCAICRIISWIFALSAKQIKLVLQARSTLLPGVCVTMPSTSTVSADGSKPAKCALSIIASGSFRNMAIKVDGASRTSR